MPVFLTHTNKAPHVRHERGYIAEPAISSDFGRPLAEIYRHITQWPVDVLFDFAGPPDYTVNRFLDGNFYVIWNRPNRYVGSGDRRLWIQIKPWCIGDTLEVEPYVRWYPDYDGVSYSEYSYNFVNDWAADDYGDQSDMKAIYLEGNYTPTAGTFGCSKLKLNYIMAASVTMGHLPPPTSDLSLTNLAATNAAIEVGQPIKGYGAGADTLGNLYHAVGEGAGVDAESMEAMSRRCLFQWGHPGGWYIPAGSTDYKMGDFKFRFKPRNLTNTSGGTLKCLPALVVSGGKSGNTVTMTTYDHADVQIDSWTFSWPVGGYWNIGAPVPTLITAADGGTPDIDVALETLDSGEEVCYADLKVTAAAGVLGDCAIHTVALFEPGEW